MVVDRLVPQPPFPQPRFPASQRVGPEIDLLQFGRGTAGVALLAELLEEVFEGRILSRAKDQVVGLRLSCLL